MAFYVDEEEVWKCPKHPSKRRRSGICPTCLRDRLITLCPECANVRPCGCCTTSSSSSSSSSFSFKRFSSVRESSSNANVGSVGRVSNLIESEPGFRRSRSVAIPFLRSRVVDKDSGDRIPNPVDLSSSSRSRSSFWSVFKKQKSKGDEGVEVDDDAKRNLMMMRSKSVGFSLLPGGGDFRSSKGKGWYFPSPMKVFRQSKASKVVQERSPICRG